MASAKEQVRTWIFEHAYKYDMSRILALKGPKPKVRPIFWICRLLEQMIDPELTKQYSWSENALQTVVRFMETSSGHHPPEVAVRIIFSLVTMMKIVVLLKRLKNNRMNVDKICKFFPSTESAEFEAKTEEMYNLQEADRKKLEKIKTYTARYRRFFFTLLADASVQADYMETKFDDDLAWSADSIRRNLPKYVDALRQRIPLTTLEEIMLSADHHLRQSDFAVVRHLLRQLAAAGIAEDGLLDILRLSEEASFEAVHGGQHEEVQQHQEVQHRRQVQVQVESVCEVVQEIYRHSSGVETHVQQETHVKVTQVKWEHDDELDAVMAAMPEYWDDDYNAALLHSDQTRR